MTVMDKVRKKRVFIASSHVDVAEVHKAMHELDLDAVTLDQTATPGTTWVDSLHRCLDAADMVIGIMGDRRKDANIFFELGVASALNKPTLLFLGADYPIDQIPPSGIPYLRMDLHNEDAVIFGLKQALSLSPRDQLRKPVEGFTTQPIGAAADELLERLAQSSALEFEDLINDAIKASGAQTIARGGEAKDKGVDFAVWSSDLEPTIANPLLIECKSQPPLPVKRQRIDRPDVSCLGSYSQRHGDHPIQGVRKRFDDSSKVFAHSLRVGRRFHRTSSEYWSGRVRPQAPEHRGLWALVHGRV